MTDAERAKLSPEARQILNIAKYRMMSHTDVFWLRRAADELTQLAAENAELVEGEKEDAAVLRKMEAEVERLAVENKQLRESQTPWRTEP